ncbi:MAG: thiamine pyrophosphate-requiring protein, partial [Verrucomicrobia bacterium]|nr:thiamine pyrophosphate-requiring protein [Verrucomicrobiota bacterium]
FNASQRIPDVPYHKFAELIGLKGIFVDNPDRVGAAWEEALAADRPVVVEFKTDPEVPPLPPHITFAQAKNFMSAVLSDPNASEMVKGTVKDAIQGILPHKK